jgi:hypothetical protein
MIIKFIIINIEAIEISIGWCKLPSNGLRGGAIAPKGFEESCRQPLTSKEEVGYP